MLQLPDGVHKFVKNNYPNIVMWCNGHHRCQAVLTQMYHAWILLQSLVPTFSTFRLFTKASLHSSPNLFWADYSPYVDNDSKLHSSCPSKLTLHQLLIQIPLVVAMLPSNMKFLLCSHGPCKWCKQHGCPVLHQKVFKDIVAGNSQNLRLHKVCVGNSLLQNL